MKKIIFVLFIAHFSLIAAKAQSGWFWQNPLPQGNNLTSLRMINTNTGFCVNSDNILKTTNGGENWTINYTGFNSVNNSLSMVDQNVGYIFLDSTTVIKTMNGGSNWSFVSEVGNIPGAKIYFLSNSTGFILGRNGIYNWKGTKLLRTSNGGVNWNTILSDTGYTLYDIMFPSQYTGYAVGNKYYGPNYRVKFFKTTDGGITWDTIENNIPVGANLVFFVNENEGYVAGQGISYYEGVYKTTNGGLGWDTVNYSFQYISDIYFVNQNTGYILSSSINRIYRTTDAGLSWVSFQDYQAIGHNELYEIFYFDNNTGFFIGTGGLIVKTTNGGQNWIKKSYGEDVYFDDVKFFDANTGFVGGEYGKLLRTTDGGLNWSVMQFGNDDLAPIAMIDNYNWYVVYSDYGNILKTTNTGATWDTLYTNQAIITRLDFINVSTGFGVCKYGSFFKTTNAGLNWTTSNPFASGHQYWALDFIDQNTGYVGSSVILYKTTNGGNTWESINFGIEYSPSDIQFLNYNTGFMSGGNVDLSGYHGIVMKTTNAGINWVNTEVTNYSTLSDIFLVNERIGFTTCGNRVYKTTNGGGNWFQIRTCSYNSLSVSYFVDTLTGYVVGSFGTILKTTNGGYPIGITPISTTIPNSFSLSQNYPNPFNPSTKIKFEIPMSPLSERGVGGFITLKIYDLLGREVTTLVNEQLQPGAYEASWDGTNYPSGVYFYKLSSGDFSESKKMILLK